MPCVFYFINKKIDKLIEFDLFSNKKEPGALPQHLILINKFIPIPGKYCTTYDIDEGLVTIYENFKAFRTTKVLARIQLKMCYAPFIDILHRQSKEANSEQAFFVQDLDGNLQKDLSDYVKNNQSMLDLMSYNVLYGMSLLELILRDKDACTSFLQKLDLLQPQDQIFMNVSLTIPIIKSGVEHVLSQDYPDINVVRGLFKFIGQTDPTGLLYQEVAYRHINGLMTKSVPLHEYFDSPLAHIPQDEEKL